MKTKFTDPKHGTDPKPSKREDYPVNKDVMKEFNKDANKETTNFYHG